MFKDHLFCALSIPIFLLIVEAKEKCGICVPIDQCPFYANLTRENKDRWASRFDCTKVPTERAAQDFGFVSIAKGDMICCPEIGNNGAQNVNDNPKPIYNAQRNNDYYRNRNGIQHGHNEPVSDYFTGINNANSDHNTHIYKNQNSFQLNNQDDNYGSNSYFPPKQINNNNPNFNGRNYNFGGSNSGRQCPVTSSPPDPNTGCCGREATNSGNIAGSPYAPFNSLHPTPSVLEARTHALTSEVNDLSGWPFDSQTNDNFPFASNATRNKRITRGQPTELEQYPWTVFLTTIFNEGMMEKNINCGGSLISSRFVLTAAHCVVMENAILTQVKVTLAEYDKRTFPRDCTYASRQVQKCVQNVVMYADTAIPHPQYKDKVLHNDIALLKLQGAAPYTDYIRPICLPPFNVANSKSNLRLPVAGWGLNGQYDTAVKQATVVNLVLHRECREYYPYLSEGQLCAVGYSGEDTCPGDSGGPLMMLYKGNYYLTGIVSGKREDVPCGYPIPSLYTNVYPYLQWIRSNMRD